MKADLAIVAKGIGKQYAIGAQQRNTDSLREAVMDAAKAAVQTLRGGWSGIRQRREQNSFWALKDIDFEVRQGEVVGIIGGNGAGKSTLLKVLSRITDPTAGMIELRGRVGSLLEVGTGFHQELTGRENIFLNGAVLGMSRAQVRRQFDAIVEFSGVGKFVDTPVKRYSSGMYLRLAFAVAAHLEPDILLVDEVLAVGDAQFQAKCLGKMESVAEEGRTVLFVSHNMAAVRSLCNRGIVLRDGRIVHQGPIQDAIQNYFADLGIVGPGNDVEPRDQRHVFGRVRVGAERSNTIHQSDPFEVSTTFALPQPVRNFRLFCFINDARNQQLVGVLRSSQELGFADGVPTGRHSVKVQFPPLWLNPGMYSVYFKLLVSGQTNGWKHLSDMFPLDVCGDSSSVDAVMNPASTWELKPLQQQPLTAGTSRGK